MDDDAGGNSTFLALAEGLLSDDAAENLKDTLDRMGLSPNTVDAAAASGVGFGEQVDLKTIINAATGDPAPGTAEGPAYHTREIEDTDGRIAGTRVLLDIPPHSVDPFTHRGERTLLLRTPEGDVEIGLNHIPSTIEYETADDDGFTEMVVRPPVQVERAEDGDDD